MSAARQGSLGATRICPHCKATVLASASICPGCQHHLRFNVAAAEQRPAGPAAMRIEGTIANPAAADGCEYCVVVSISNQLGEKIARQVVGVGALAPGERHSYAFSVELIPAQSAAQRNKG
ncbi:MAG: hypothetical protein KGL92_00125 [Gammaproteobacteria bacterium]|nr:hypothetical protein [Gammaproteobacteria bacterium]MDE2346882.1 hypothetical protein [Gammaproteobacteria bacterium]